MNILFSAKAAIRLMNLEKTAMVISVYQSKYKTKDNEQIENKPVLQIIESLTLYPLFSILREQEVMETGCFCLHWFNRKG
jgi:hypothetical protein